MLTRRGLLGGILAAGFAPAFVGAKVLMPVRQVLSPPDTGGLSVGDRFTIEGVPGVFRVSAVDIADRADLIAGPDDVLGLSYLVNRPTQTRRTVGASWGVKPYISVVN